MPPKKGASKKKHHMINDAQVHKNFSYNLDACVVQGSREDMDSTPTGQGVVEQVWVMSRPPRLGRGVEPTVSARRAYVMLTHVQGQMIDAGELVCKKVCTMNPPPKEGTAPIVERQYTSCAPRGQDCCDDKLLED